MQLSIRNLTKTYPRGPKAIDEISLDLGAGMFGLLGPNGAGKSTLMRTIATLQYPDSGHIHWNGSDIFTQQVAYRKKLGYLPQSFGVYPKTSAWKLLDYLAALKGIASKKARALRIDELLELTNLQEVRHRAVHTFSGGMKQRFGIAQLLLNQPEVIVVDEPTAGLDPAERTRFLNILRNIGSENIVLFSTHLVEDVQALCKQMAIIHQGRLLAKTDPTSACQQLQGKIWETERSLEVLETSGLSFLKLSDYYNEHNQLVQRVYSEQVGVFSRAVSPKLEDFYFLTLNNSAL